MGLRNLKLNTKATKRKQETPKQGNIPVLPMYCQVSVREVREKWNKEFNKLIRNKTHSK